MFTHKIILPVKIDPSFSKIPFAVLLPITFTTANLGCGPNAICQINISAIDMADNIIEKSFNLTVDTTSPVIEAINLSDYHVQNNTAVNITVNVTDGTGSGELSGATKPLPAPNSPTKTSG